MREPRGVPLPTSAKILVASSSPWLYCTRTQRFASHFTATPHIAHIHFVSHTHERHSREREREREREIRTSRLFHIRRSRAHAFSSSRLVLFIRMILHRKFPIRSLDLFITRILPEPEHLIVIPRKHTQWKHHNHTREDGNQKPQTSHRHGGVGFSLRPSSRLERASKLLIPRLCMYASRVLLL